MRRHTAWNVNECAHNKQGGSETKKIWNYLWLGYVRFLLLQLAAHINDQWAIFAIWMS